MKKASFKFTKSIAFAGFLLASACGISVYALFYPSQVAENEYRQLLNKANAANSNVPEQPYRATQHRKKIQKDLLLTQGDERLRLRLTSDQADVVVDRQLDSTDLIENMRLVKCLMQEELFESGLIPMQHIRYMEAESATYYYKTERLVAHQVSLFRYTLPGHELKMPLVDDKPSMKGKAKTLEFSVGDGKKMTLNGEVILQHPLGTIFAHEVVMNPSSTEKKLCLSTFDMNKNVVFNLKDGGELRCARAQFNYQTLEGQFFGDPEHEFVVYRELGRHQPLTVSSRNMILHIDKASQKYFISNIIAENQVAVDYNRDFIASADSAAYQRINPSEPVEGYTTLPGIITMYGTCKVINNKGDLITAKQIEIDTNKQHIHFSYPKGTLFIAQYGKQSDGLDFSSDTLLWDNAHDVMIMREHVAINQKGLGRLTSEEEVKFFHHRGEGKNQISTIESNGKTVLTRKDEKKDLSHVITCYGKLIIDHLNLVATMESPIDNHGEVIENSQVVYQDPLGEFYADKVIIQYKWAGKEIVPEKLQLIGHVRLLDNSTVHNGTHSPLSKYALSDRLEYNPLKKEALFTAANGGRVLFYSKANDLEVSAPALKIKRDEITKKESIQGIGDVRFNFIEHEFDQLKQRFSKPKKHQDL